MSLRSLLRLEDKDSGWNGPASSLPIEFIPTLRQYPLPITIGGASNVTFTLNASVTNPVHLWNGDGYISLRRTVAFTWTNTANAILDSTGAVANDVDSVLGIWYMYLDAAGDTIFPSQTGPGFVEGVKQAGLLGHPGTASADFYRYVGFMECTTAATPAFKTMIKVGYWYKFAEVSKVVITDAWTGIDFSLNFPKLAFAGMEVRGNLELASNGTITCGSHTASTIWDAQHETTAGGVQDVFFTMSPNDTSTTEIYAIAAAAGDMHIFGIKDVV